MNWKRNKSAKVSKADNIAENEKFAEAVEAKNKATGDDKSDVDFLNNINKVDKTVDSFDKRALLEKIRAEKQRRELEKYRKNVEEKTSEESAEGFFQAEFSQSNKDINKSGSVDSEKKSDDHAGSDKLAISKETQTETKIDGGEEARNSGAVETRGIGGTNGEKVEAEKEKFVEAFAEGEYCPGEDVEKVEINSARGEMTDSEAVSEVSEDFAGGKVTEKKVTMEKSSKKKAAGGKNIHERSVKVEAGMSGRKVGDERETGETGAVAEESDTPVFKDLSSESDEYVDAAETDNVSEAVVGGKNSYKSVSDKETALNEMPEEETEEQEPNSRNAETEPEVTVGRESEEHKSDEKFQEQGRLDRKSAPDEENEAEEIEDSDEIQESDLNGVNSDETAKEETKEETKEEASEEVLKEAASGVIHPVEEKDKENKVLAQLWLATKASKPQKGQNKKPKKYGNKEDKETTPVYDENELVEWNSGHAFKAVPKLFWFVLSLCVICVLSFVLYNQYILHLGNKEISNYKIRSLNDAEYVSENEELIEPVSLKGVKLISQEDYDNDNFISNKAASNSDEEDNSEQNSGESKPEYSLEGKGSEEEPYLIKNANDLVFIAEQIEELPRKNEFRTSYFKQTADIKINDFTADDLDKVYMGDISPQYNWKAIGSSAKPFEGHYDGAGHKISGLYYELDGAGNNKSNYAGLFAYINSAEIKNLTIDSAVILAKNHKAVGTLSGIASNDSKIENVEINSYVENDGSVGGFFGKVIGRSVNLDAKNLKYSGRVASYYSDPSDEADPAVDEETKVDKVHTAAAFAASAEGVNLSDFVNEGEILSIGSAAGAIGHLSISSNQIIEKISNNGRVYSDNLASGLISSIDSAGNYKLVIKDNENNGAVSAKKSAAGILASISLYSSDNYSGDLLLENNINNGEIKADVASAVSARVLLDKGQYFSAINNVNRAKISARKLASGLIADLSFVGGNGTLSQNKNEEGAEISTTLTDGRFLYGNAAGFIARMTFNVDKPYSNLRIVNNSNKAAISSAKIAAGLIAEANVRINTAVVDNEDANRIEIAQNINFADVKNAHYISGLVGVFDILSSKDYFSQLRSNNKSIILIKNNAVYGNLINDIYESRNYMVGLFMGPKLNFRSDLQGNDEIGPESADDGGNVYLNGDILLSEFNRDLKSTAAVDLEAEKEYHELLEEQGVAKSSKVDPNKTESTESKNDEREKSSSESESSTGGEAVTDTKMSESLSDNELESDGQPGDFVNYKKGAITYLINNLFAGKFEINDKNLDYEMNNDLLRNLRMQTAALGKLTDYTWVENNFALPYTNHFAKFDFVTAYQYPMMIAYGNNPAFNIKDAAVVPGNRVREESSYEGFDFGNTWAMDSDLGIPVPVQ